MHTPFVVIYIKVQRVKLMYRSIICRQHPAKSALPLIALASQMTIVVVDVDVATLKKINSAVN